MENYDPNMTSSGRMAKQKVRLLFQVWDYKVEFVEEVGGNCTGFDVIGTAIGNLYENLPDAGGIPEIKLYKEGCGNCLEEYLLVSDEDDKGEDFLKDILVRAEIESIVADPDFWERMEAAGKEGTPAPHP